jgi:hypothetical protein
MTGCIRAPIMIWIVLTEWGYIDWVPDVLNDLKYLCLHQDKENKDGQEQVLVKVVIICIFTSLVGTHYGLFLPSTIQFHIHVEI